MPAKQNGHTRKWKESTEEYNEFTTITEQHTELRALDTYHIDITPETEDCWKRTRATLTTAAEKNNSTLTFYTDGALNTNSDNKANPVMGAGWINKESETTIYHGIQGNVSSTNAEAKAILSALECSPNNTKIKIYTDSQAAYTMM